MKPIIFVGYRLNLHDILLVTRALDRQVVGVIDKYFYGNTDEVCGIPIVGSEDLLSDKTFTDDHDFFLTSWWDGYENVENPEHSGDNLRQTRIKLLEDNGVKCTNLIHPQCTELEDTQLGNGIIAMPMSGISHHCDIGDHCVIDWYSYVGHNCKICKNFIVGARSSLAGYLNIEDNVRIGLSVTIAHGHGKPDLTVHKNAKLWTGAVVLDSVPANTNYTHDSRLLKRLTS